MRTNEPGVRSLRKREGGSSAPSRTAAIGGTLVARRAGRTLATRVTTTPTTSETTIVRGSIESALAGSSNPALSNSFINPTAMPKPEKRPTTEARRLTTRDSITTDPSTWIREAPSVRRVANSRVRWAIVIESELTITKAPTKSAIPPNASRMFRKTEMPAEVSELCSSICASAVLTS